MRHKGPLRNPGPGASAPRRLRLECGAVLDPYLAVLGLDDARGDQFGESAPECRAAHAGQLAEFRLRGMDQVAARGEAEKQPREPRTRRQRDGVCEGPECKLEILVAEPVEMEKV